MKSTGNSATAAAETVPFTVGRSDLWRTLMLIPSRAWPVWLIAVLAVALLIAGIIASLPLMIIGLLLLFAVFPASASFMFLAGITSEGIVPNIVPHTLTRLSDGWQLNLFRKSVSADPEGNEAVEWQPCGSVTVCDSQIAGREQSMNYDILFFKDSSLSLLFIPRF